MKNLVNGIVIVTLISIGLFAFNVDMPRKDKNKEAFENGVSLICDGRVYNKADLTAEIIGAHVFSKGERSLLKTCRIK